MKKLIGIIAFVTIGLFGSIHEAPAAQADNRTTSSLMASNELALRGPCPPQHPFCCEFEEDGSCYACAGGGLECP